LNLKIFYETNFGEDLYVLGHIEEMGSWKKYKCGLLWTEGHIWVTEKPIITNEPYFAYKYILLEQGSLKVWETGVNRMADLTILPPGQPLSHQLKLVQA